MDGIPLDVSIVMSDRLLSAVLLLFSVPRYTAFGFISVIEHIIVFEASCV